MGPPFLSIYKVPLGSFSVLHAKAALGALAAACGGLLVPCLAQQAMAKGFWPPSSISDLFIGWEP